jgi:Superinfection immunity protein
MGDPAMEWRYYWNWNGLSFLVTLLVSLFIYFLPSLIAFARRHVQAAPIFILNLFFGWTVIAWVGCLAWAVSANTRRTTTG